MEGLAVMVREVDAAGWVDWKSQVGWAEDENRRARPAYRARGGRETLATRAIREVSGIPAAEADRIADETLNGWSSLLRSADIVAASEQGTRRLIIVVGAIALFVVAFVALLVIVLFKVVF